MSEKAAPRVPTRLIARLLSEIQQAMAVGFARLLRERNGRAMSFEASVLLTTVLRNDPRFRAAASGVSGSADTQAHGISVNAAAATLGRPFETIRRYALALQCLELIETGPRGLIISPAFQQSADYAALLRWLHDLIVSLIEDMARLGLPLPATRREMPYQPDVTIATGLDLGVTPIEFLARIYDSWSEMLMVNTAITASVRHITYDPELAWRFAWPETPPSRDQRRGARVRGIGAAHGLPYSTASRHVRAALDKGMLMRKDDGVIATDRFLASDAFSQAGAALAGRAIQALSRLVPGGFPFDDPASRYIEGRPPRVEF